ncbi:hypothetical protein PPSIR1_40750 [Plesiocystis pacifica SIR-1]|uniref:Uncharacterized protein n=1 Tax=Plesiocystis pacifica SIR-1 TaxID=391625 RepID=A6FYT0_9BACT|nr:hypothetical protein [Plesiocystis pacifica]EDM81352.1 hypothetical protein PPSIR1_40750 [Plesiocystis pacifica SIR-1]
MAKNDFYIDATTVLTTLKDNRAPAGSLARSNIAAIGQNTTRKVRELDDDLRNWLLGLQLLERVPFHYIVPDARMLPPESVRMFYIDRTWTDRLVQGAISAGAVSNGELKLTMEAAVGIRNQLDKHGGQGDQVTGMLLRSILVRRWPRMEIRAFRNKQRLTNLRVARISEGILLVLWHGVPNLVEIEEPKHGVQFGINADPSLPAPTREDPYAGGYVEPRDPDTGDTTTLRDAEPRANVMWRVPPATLMSKVEIDRDRFMHLVKTKKKDTVAHDNVLDIDALARQLAADFEVPSSVNENKVPASVDEHIDSRYMAMALQQFPFVQPFRSDARASTDEREHYPPLPPKPKDHTMSKGLIAVMPLLKTYFDNPTDEEVQIKFMAKPQADVAVAAQLALQGGLNAISATTAMLLAANKDDNDGEDS